MANTDGIDSERFILEGLLECEKEEIRDSFKQSFAALAKNKQSSKVLLWLLTLLSRHFVKVSEYPSKQYFDIFIELLDEHLKQDGNDRAEFNPDELLTAIISKIKRINNGEDENSNEQMFTGMIRLMTKIIENYLN